MCHFNWHPPVTSVLWMHCQSVTWQCIRERERGVFESKRTWGSRDLFIANTVSISFFLKCALVRSPSISFLPKFWYALNKSVHYSKFKFKRTIQVLQDNVHCATNNKNDILISKNLWRDSNNIYWWRATVMWSFYTFNSYRRKFKLQNIMFKKVFKIRIY